MLTLLAKLIQNYSKTLGEHGLHVLVESAVVKLSHRSLCSYLFAVLDSLAAIIGALV